MKDRLVEKPSGLRRTFYLLLIVATCAAAAGRIMTVESKSGDTPFLSANDRSRWSTVRALVDHGTFELDDVIFRTRTKQVDGQPVTEVVRVRDWYSIDLVKHRGWDGKEHYYSSKPTLLTVLLAGEYWLIKHTLGITIAEHPFYVGRLMLLLTNVLPLAAYLYVLARVIERYGQTDWGRLFTFTAAAFGTYITTFSVTLNNHTLAAATALFAVHAVLRIWREPNPGWRWYVWAGFCAALTVTNELPALALLGLLGLVVLYRSPLKAIVGFGLPVLLVATAALGTNYYAHGSWKTPYAHRKDGKVIAEIKTTGQLEQETAELNAAKLPASLRAKLEESGIELSSNVIVDLRERSKRWVLRDVDNGQRYAIVFNPMASMIDYALEVREWDNWYDYEGTYWTEDKKTGVDKGEPSRLVYAFHCLLGHHGIFSLTPIWLLAVVGVWRLRTREETELRGFALMVVMLTLVVLAFYIVQRPLEDRNYGGVSSGLRWMFWFTPLWLIAMLPAADIMASSRWRKIAAFALLGISVFSAHYASLNPWSQPWIFDFWTYLGWIEY